MTTLDRAEAFLWVNARLLDRRRFAFHFRSSAGDRERVLDALRPYQNADGGFGHALEPDLRGPESQPVATEVALVVLDEVGAVGGDLLDGTLRYLESITRPDGGVPWVLPTSSPRAPWWNPVEGLPGAVNPTASIAGLLLKNDVRHPWLDRAVDFCWTALESSAGVDAYDALCILRFLEFAPDRPRAESAWQSLSRSVVDRVDLDPAAEGDVHGPLEFAPRPESLARSLFSVELFERHLDLLEAEQKEDGGWDFTFPSWTPITRPDWRGWATVESLKTLRVNGRL
jgi:hypothetical protein